LLKAGIEADERDEDGKTGKTFIEITTKNPE